MSTKKFVAIVCTLLFDIPLIAVFISNITRPKYWIPTTGKIVGSASTSCGDSMSIVPALSYELNGMSYNDLENKEFHMIKIFDGGDVDIFVNPRVNSQYVLKSETGIFKNILLVPIYLLINATLVSQLLHDPTRKRPELNRNTFCRRSVLVDYQKQPPHLKQKRLFWPSMPHFIFRHGSASDACAG